MIKFKLKWYKDKEKEYDIFGSEKKAVVWKAKVYNYVLIVYPLRLYEKKAKGWGYKIVNAKTNEEEYDSGYPPHEYYIPTTKKAKELAEEIFREVIKEKRIEQWGDLKSKIIKKLDEMIK
jgi:hypothetical protein